MTSSKISTKAEFLTLAASGALGNQLRVWPTIKAMLSEYEGQCVIRAHDKQSPWMVPWSQTSCECGVENPNIHCRSGCFRRMVEADLFRVTRLSHLDESAFYFQEVPRRSTVRVANMELMEDIGGFYMHIEHRSNEAVRGIRERTEPLYGARAWLTLKNTISEESYETLQAIWERFPGAAIEATEFPMAVGTLRKRLVIWEVRHF